MTEYNLRWEKAIDELSENDVGINEVSDVAGWFYLRGTNLSEERACVPREMPRSAALAAPLECFAGHTQNRYRHFGIAQPHASPSLPRP